MLDDLRPPEAYAHLRWHWLMKPIMPPAEEAEPVLCKWMHDQQWWIEGGARRHPGPSMSRAGYTYWKPCDPAALTINPADAGQVERVVEAAKIAIADYEDARQYSTRDSMEDLRAALKALSDA